MKYHYKPHELLKRKIPSDLGLEYTFVQRIELDNSIRIETKSEEACLVVLKGEVIFSSSNQAGRLRFKDMLYIPRNSKISITSKNAILMYYEAPSNIDSSVTHIKFLGNQKTIQSDMCGILLMKIFNVLDL